MAKLPPKLEEDRQIIQRKVGDTGYTVPWAMSVDLDGECYINGSFTMYERPMGTASMPIRIERDGIIVYFPVEMKFSREKLAKDRKWIPVVEFSRFGFTYDG